MQAVPFHQRSGPHCWQPSRSASSRPSQSSWHSRSTGGAAVVVSTTSAGGRSRGQREPSLAAGPPDTDRWGGATEQSATATLPVFRCQVFRDTELTSLTSYFSVGYWMYSRSGGRRPPVTWQTPVVGDRRWLSGCDPIACALGDRPGQMLSVHPGDASFSQDPVTLPTPHPCNGASGQKVL